MSGPQTWCEGCGGLAREIGRLKAECAGLKYTLDMWVAECGEGGPRAIKANVQALAEALTKIMPSIVLFHGPIGGPWLDTWEREARAALARANTIAEAERVIIWRGSGSDLATDVAEILLDPTAARTDELGRFLDKWIKLIPPRDGVRRGRG